jgi:hypothetical protein
VSFNEAQQQTKVKVLVDGTDQVIAKLNDAGCSPDTQAGDGKFTGLLDWQQFKDLPEKPALRLRWSHTGEAISVLADGGFEIMPCQFDSARLLVSPSRQLTVNSHLTFRAVVKPRILPGTFAVHIGAKPGTELQLRDDGKGLDRRAGDGVWSAEYTGSLAAWPSETALPLTLEHRSISGTLLASVAGRSLSVARPAVFLTSFCREPAGPVEYGSRVILRVTFNKTTPITFARVIVGENRLDTVIGDMHVVNGKSVDTGEWWAELKYDNVFDGPCENVPIRAEYQSRGHVQSAIQGDPITILPPDLEITGLRFDPAPPLTAGADVLVHVTTNKAIPVGGIRVLIGGQLASRLIDDGEYVPEPDWSIVSSYRDETAADGDWVGLLHWGSEDNPLQVGPAVPVRAEYCSWGHVPLYPGSDQYTQQFEWRQVLVSSDAGTVAINQPPTMGQR